MTLIAQPRNFLETLKSRGLFHQATHVEELALHLSSHSRLIYSGLDPTANSLTIGNLIPILLLRHAQLAGHVPIVLIGGGTGLIGDPSGKSSERTLLEPDIVAENVKGQLRVLEKLLDFSKGSLQAQIVNNLDWLKSLSYLELLREIGKHFSINAMIQRDSVKERLNNREQGISYTEFSYMILQAYDFYHLAKTKEVSVQMGGSDQFGNIVSGCDLIRRKLPNQPAFGITTPLLTKPDGTKFGKTEKGSIWLTKDRTSPYQFYQFFMNTDDQNVIRFLKIFTFLPLEEIEAIEKEQEQNPGARVAHKTLALAITEMIHGTTEAKQAEEASLALFSGDISQLSKEMLEEIFATLPQVTQPCSLIPIEGLPAVDVLMLTNGIKSRREARELLSAGSILFNGTKVTEETKLRSNELLHGSLLAVRKGKKQWFLVKFISE